MAPSDSAASDAEAFDKGAGELVAAVLYADHRHCDPESCCQANSGPDATEAEKVLRALRDGGYLR